MQRLRTRVMLLSRGSVSASSVDAFCRTSSGSTSHRVIDRSRSRFEAYFSLISRRRASRIAHRLAERTHVEALTHPRQKIGFELLACTIYAVLHRKRVLLSSIRVEGARARPGHTYNCSRFLFFRSVVLARRENNHLCWKCIQSQFVVREGRSVFDVLAICFTAKRSTTSQDAEIAMEISRPPIQETIPVSARVLTIIFFEINGHASYTRVRCRYRFNK